MKTKIRRTVVTGLIAIAGTLIPNNLLSSNCCTKPNEYSASPEISYANRFTPLARKNIENLTNEERAELTERLRMRESSGRADAVGVTIRTRRVNGETSADTIYSVGENQINISRGGALADYNQMHRIKFSEEDMIGPVKNRIVRNWYLFQRIPQLLNFYGLETTVANTLTGYNTGIGNLIKAGGDAIRDFDRLPKITRDYIQNITRE